MTTKSKNVKPAVTAIEEMDASPVVQEVLADVVVETVAETTVQLAENAEVIAETVVKINKADIARKIFAEELEKVNGGHLVRKDVIKRFRDEAGLTEKGAATYFQNFKKKADQAVAEPNTEVVEQEAVAA